MVYCLIQAHAKSVAQLKKQNAFGYRSQFHLKNVQKVLLLGQKELEDGPTRNCLRYAYERLQLPSCYLNYMKCFYQI